MVLCCGIVVFLYDKLQLFHYSEETKGCDKGISEKRGFKKGKVETNQNIDINRPREMDIFEWKLLIKSCSNLSINWKNDVLWVGEEERRGRRRETKLRVGEKKRGKVWIT